MLVRTDGLWIVFDASKPLGRMDVYVGSKEGAIGEAERLKLVDEQERP